MKKVLLAGIAALLLSGAVSRADKLPKQMLGDWCEAESGQFFERGTCERKFKLKGNGYEGYADTEGYGCDFKSIRQLTGSSWFVRSECGGEAGLVPGDHVIAIEGKTLKIINVTVSVCLAVIDPPAEVTKDPEFKADSWLVLREAPDTKSKAVVKLGTENEMDNAIAELVKNGVGALLLAGGPFFNNNRTRLVALTADHRLPAIAGEREFTEAGGLMSYGTNVPDVYRQIGIYSGRILRGEKPSDLPFLQPSKFDFAVNLKTARALGLEIPPSILARADEVIE